MKINVRSEIGKLKRVMLHRPGKELEHLVPGELERLLFDDIPFLKTAQKEHDEFAGILRSRGVDVVYLEDLMADVLRSDHDVKDVFIRQFISEGGKKANHFSEELYDYLLSIGDEKQLVLKTMSGVRVAELLSRQKRPLVDLVKPDRRFVLDPIPNLYFTRDPFASIGNGVSLNQMYSSTRRRETIYGQFILDHHMDEDPAVKYYYHRNDPYSIEGGDILNISEDVLAVGLSQRTTPEAVEMLAENLFADEECKIRTVIALDIPDIRTFMHLDTVCTQVDHDRFLVHPGILSTLKIYELKPGGNGSKLAARQLDEPLDQVLTRLLPVSRVRLIFCGGSDRIASEREQWNDGSNTLCIEPGCVIAYDRNSVTNEILRDNGIEVLEIPSSELSRGRGGPRCMSMPLIRSFLFT